MPDQTATAQQDQDAGYWPLEFVDPVLSTVGRGSWMNLKVTFCGITTSLREWIQVAGLRAATVRARLTRGMDPVQALTTPDHVGRCLQPLSVEFLELYRKARESALSGVVSMSDARSTTHVACIIAYGKKIFLGTFQNRDEAVFSIQPSRRPSTRGVRPDREVRGRGSRSIDQGTDRERSTGTLRGRRTKG